MANYTQIEAAARERAGTGAARATRRAGLVPAIIYGAKQEPALIALDPRIVTRELTRGGWRSRLYEVTVGGATERALIREVQFHPVSDRPLHVDFQRLAPGERIRVAVAVHFEGDGASPGIKRGGVLNVVRHTVEVLAAPDTVPEGFTADLSGLDINDNVRFSNLRGTEGVRPVITDRDFVIATIAPPTKSADTTAVADAAADSAKSAAPAGKGAPKAAPAAKK
jgi:large subunit ribosomal protein L25